MKRGQTEELHWISNFNVYCVSDTNKAPLMWTHYADGLRGFCIEFRNADFLKYAAKVNYRASLPSAREAHKALLEISTAGYVKNDQNEVWENFKKAIDIISLTKLKEFVYESEWRIASPNENWFSYKPQDVSNIIIGERMDDDLKNLIQAILQNKYPHIKDIKIAKVKGSNIVIE